MRGWEKGQLETSWDKTAWCVLGKLEAEYQQGRGTNLGLGPGCHLGQEKWMTHLRGAWGTGGGGKTGAHEEERKGLGTPHVYLLSSEEPR